MTHLFIYCTATARSARIPIQHDGICFYVSPEAVPSWASIPSAQYAVLQASLSEEPTYRSRGISYHVRVESGAWGILRRVV